MRLPAIQGVIRRRLLVNYRADPAVISSFLPSPFIPKLHNGWSIVGICLIHLEDIRPVGLPGFLGLSSENAAHRISVNWEDNSGTKDGVFIPRRDTSSSLNHFAGGRLFPGEHHLARFTVTDDQKQVRLSIRSEDTSLSVNVAGFETDSLPNTSVFRNLPSASDFFSSGSIGYSVTSDCFRFDGIRLETDRWDVTPFEVTRVESSFFDDTKHFPSGSIEFDHALIMRDIAHRWLQEPEIKDKSRTERCS